MTLAMGCRPKVSEHLLVAEGMVIAGRKQDPGKSQTRASVCLATYLTPHRLGQLSLSSVQIFSGSLRNGGYKANGNMNSDKNLASSFLR